MTLPASETKCWCGHPKRWHQDKSKTMPGTLSAPATHCNEWGCGCRKFHEALP